MRVTELAKSTNSQLEAVLTGLVYHNRRNAVSTKTTPTKTWLKNALRGATVLPAVRREIEIALKYGGFERGIATDKESLAKQIVSKFLSPTGRLASVRTAAVVTADASCPNCGAPMVDTKLSTGDAARYCTNPKCRVTAYLG